MTSFPDSKPVATPTSWARALGRRALALWPLKLIGNTLATIGFFPLYFWVMRHSGEAWVLPLTPIDRLVAFWPALFSRDRRELTAFSLACALMTTIALVVFWCLPTAIPNFTIDTSPGTTLHFLKTKDSAGNAFPSLHVSFSVFACVVLARQLRSVGAPAWLRGLNLAWAAGIVYSTMAVRQHVLIDVGGGFVLGVVFGLATRVRATAGSVSGIAGAGRAA
jgi:membrane-associated phospholipid phosphatase